MNFWADSYLWMYVLVLSKGHGNLISRKHHWWTALNIFTNRIHLWIADLFVKLSLILQDLFSWLNRIKDRQTSQKNLSSIEIWVSFNGNIFLSCTKPFKVSIKSELLFLVSLRLLIWLNHWKNIGKFTGTTPNLIFEGFWQLENHREKRNSPSKQYITKQNLDWKTGIFQLPLVSTILEEP